ncbi:hypothetical protein ANANG_G00081810 [Anguilla anguilla]|uniref:Uncharacterized protein n=1 Tax=Anguilla anguilla TaxID=7936 RepID=A0A9D3MK36_ANGAN|nr:hypothetical protein ANANG_G00081810 [Anguilla anguilla]
MPVCEAVAAGDLCTDGIHICSFSEDIKHGSDPLLLSVEEVLRSLEPDPDPDPPAEDRPDVLPPSSLQASGTLNGPFPEAHRQPSLPLDSGAFAPCHPQPPPLGSPAPPPRPGQRGPTGSARGQRATVRRSSPCPSPPSSGALPSPRRPSQSSGSPRSWYRLQPRFPMAGRLRSPKPCWCPAKALRRPLTTGPKRRTTRPSRGSPSPRTRSKRGLPTIA